MAATGLLKRAAQQVPSSPTFKLAFIRAHASEAQAQQVEPKAQDSTTLKTFQIYRWNPENPSKPELKDYQINLKECGPMVLDALIKIKNEIDPILTFCRSCHEGICGSCAMNINGCNGLACLTKIPSATTASTITSLLHMFVIKDLVVDMANFSSFNKSSALSGTIYSRSQKDCISQPTYSPPKYSEDFQLVSFSWNNSDSSTNTERGNRFYFFFVIKRTRQSEIGWVNNESQYKLILPLTRTWRICLVTPSSSLLQLCVLQERSKNRHWNSKRYLQNTQTAPLAAVVAPTLKL